MKKEFDKIIESGPSDTILLNNVNCPEYGRKMDDFNIGDVYIHPRSITVNRDHAYDYTSTFHESSPLYRSLPYALAHGFTDTPVHPLHIFNIALSLGVQNNSEKAIANLGYYNLFFQRTVYPGDTIRSMSSVIEKKDRGDKPGIVHVRTAAVNQMNEIVLHYERKIMIPPGKSEKVSSFPDEKFPELNYTALLPHYKKCPHDLVSQTGEGTYFEDLHEGSIFAHRNMRTITDEHIPWTYKVGNTHPLHYDQIYASSLSGDMGGKCVVYGGLVFSWLAGLAGRDCTENALWDIAYTEGYHTRPAFSGDTIGSITRILKKEDGPVPGTGILQMQLIGIKNMPPRDAFQTYGEELFIKEVEKKNRNLNKIENKIFEIERKILIKKRPK